MNISLCNVHSEYGYGILIYVQLHLKGEEGLTERGVSVINVIIYRFILVD